jgi:uncharacterized protein YjiS (DUF1127 family)
MINKIKNWYRQRSMFKQTYRELSTMTNHELADLGIDRTMITRISLEAVYGDKHRV